MGVVGFLELMRAEPHIRGGYLKARLDRDSACGNLEKWQGWPGEL